MKQNEKLSLPIDAYIPAIVKAVADYSTVMIKASPGSGKTTRLPWALAKGLSKKVAVLEPRRLAAKLAAQRIADEESLRLGQEVGFHFRFEKNTTNETLLTFYTEGTFLKKFLRDSDWNDLEIVILDEFHERHIETDLALAFLRALQKDRGLKIVLMSATLDLKLLDSFPDSKTFEIEAQMFPVEISYLPNQPSVLNQSLELKVKKALESVSDGDVLVFLPGMREMLRVQGVLEQKTYLLHADLSKEEQAQALGTSAQRKIILATNIAESSVTIPGISVVIDAGIQRESHYSPWNGLKFIQDTPITKSSAIQRAGRAGRTGPGKCLRLYSQQDFNERPEHTVPEIEKADLTDVRLLVAGAVVDPVWFWPPPRDKWENAKTLLTRLGAIEEGSLTKLGKKMLDFPLDARLARVLLEGQDLPPNEKEKLLRFICEEIEGDMSGTLKRRLQFYTKTSGNDPSPWEKCLLSGFVDQVARFRPKQRDFIHYSGKTIKCHNTLDKLHDDFYIIFDITQRQEAINVLPVEESWFWDLVPFPFTEVEEVEVGKKIFLQRKTKLGSIVIEEESLKVHWPLLSRGLQEKISEQSLKTMSDRIKDWQETPVFERLLYWAQHQNFDLKTSLQGLRPENYFESSPDLDWKDFEGFLLGFVQEKIDLTQLEKNLPKHINLGGKRELTVHYPQGMDPYLEAPMQDFFGLLDTPSIMSGKIPLTLKLLGPHKRPIQITKDLKNFWQKTYPEMKKEYQRDYPRHHWPDRPWEARPILLKSQLTK